MLTQRNVLLAVLAGLLALSFIGQARAADKKDATGTWKWKTQARNGGQEREVTLKLKQDGEKLTGAILGANNQETEIKEGKVADGKISFNVVRERNGQTFTTKYSGKLDGDTIKGKIESERNGQTQSRDWEAKRAKESA